MTMRHLSRATTSVARESRGISTTVLGRATALVLGLLAASPSLLAMGPNHPLGYKPESVYEGAQVDNVDVGSGSLAVTLPLGPFSITYSSNIWNYETIVEGGYIYTQAIPWRKRTGGFAWHLGVGEVYPPNHPYNSSGKWLYIDQFGGTHSFWDDFDATHPDNDSDTFYSRDGSYLRLKVIDCLTADIESPDGSTRRFQGGWCGPSATYFLTKSWDTFGSASDPDMTVTRSAYDANGDSIWTFTDRYNRKNYLTFNNGYTYYGDPGVVTKVDIESVGGQRMVYTLDYWDYHVNRSCKDDYPGSGTRIQLPHLIRINLPDGTKYEMIENGVPTYENLCGGAQDAPGFLEKLILPTRGAYEWDIQEFTFNGSAPWNTTAAVKERRMVDSLGTVLGTWKYKQTYYPKSGSDEAETATWVQQPTGDCTKHYFFHDDTSSWEQGLPYTKRQAQVDGKHLSSEVWSGSAGNGECSGTKLRSTYLKYRKDVLPTGSNQSEHTATNRRAEDSRVIYHDDGDKYVDTDSSNDDGLGHWRLRTVSHNFDGTVKDRLSKVQYDKIPNILQYTNGSWAPPTPSDNWILGTFEYTQENDTNATGELYTRRFYQFDSTTGFLECTRQSRVGTSRTTTDVVQVFEPTTRGEVAEVKTYGGDFQTLDTSTTCDNLPSQPESWVKHTYENGVRKTSRPYQPDGTAGIWLTYDVDLDASTGAVMAIRDANGLTTTFAYNSLALMTQATLPSGAYWEYQYDAPTTTTPAKVTSSKRWPGGGSFDESATWFDEFGRAEKQRHLEPGSVWKESTTSYNSRGWVLSKSNMGEASQLTQYLNYDAFGRPTVIQPPEGVNHEVRFTYTGDRIVETEARTLLTGIGYQWVPKYSYRDGFGRTTRVEEYSDASDVNRLVATEYDYDVSGNLTSVEQDTAGTVMQSRSFVYNNLGNLLSETHPEIGSTGNGTVTYGSYDSRGNAYSRDDGRVDVDYEYDWLGRLVKVKDANNSSRTVTQTVYDTASGPGLGRVHKLHRYNYLELPWTPTQGEESTRVTEVYAYRASDGAATTISTYIYADLDSTRSGEYQRFWIRPNPDEWGLNDRMTYPRCSNASCSSTTGSIARTINTDWSHGRIQRVNGWTNDLTYHPSGTWATIPHTNGTQDSHTVQASNNARTLALNTTNPGVLWNTGSYTYDGSGNIITIGDTSGYDDLYRYDKVNRLTRAYVRDAATGDSTRQDYTYDVFGNMTEVKTWPVGGGTQTTTIAVNQNTNRLSVAGYDASGNMTSWGSDAYSYDTGNSMTEQNGRWFFLYNFSGERVATIDWQGSISTREVDFTIRGPGNQVLSTFNLTGEDQSGNWTHTMDYIWMGRRLLGTEDGSGTQQHYHTDHLGSIRLVTDSLGAKVSEHEYLPYGEELTAAGNGVMKFTGHERDSDTGMDYMHARFYISHLGRMMSVDPVMQGAGPNVWNRYSYVGGRPLSAIDPTGQKIACVDDPTGNIDRALISLAQRKSGRAMLIAAHQDDRTYTIGHADISPPASIDHYEREIKINSRNGRITYHLLHELFHMIYFINGFYSGNWESEQDEHRFMTQDVIRILSEPKDSKPEDAFGWLLDEGIANGQCGQYWEDDDGDDGDDPPPEGGGGGGDDDGGDCDDCDDGIPPEHDCQPEEECECDYNWDWQRATLICREVCITVWNC